MNSESHTNLRALSTNVPIHALAAEEALAAHQVDRTTGLSTEEVHRLRALHGVNRLREQRAQSAWSVCINQFKSLIVLLLTAALLLSIATSDWLEAVAIGVVIVLNATIGFVSEIRAARSMEALRRLGRAHTSVRRDGKVHRIEAEDLVPGDIVLIDAGDVVTADLRIIESSKLQADESTLTGESVPVEKNAETVADDTVIAERHNMLYKGTAATRGSAEGVVCATGMNTELGRITSLVDSGGEKGDTPLEQRLDRLGRRLVWLTLTIALVVALAGIASGKDAALIIRTSLALAVAAVPEGLPIVATLTLARGMWRMAKRNVLINRLEAVETLGATTIVLTDKTGTLTENKMTVSRVATNSGCVELDEVDSHEIAQFARDGKPINPVEDPELHTWLEAGVLCSNAEWGENGPIGDPMETAFLVACTAAGLDPAAVRSTYPETFETAFDPQTRMMATYHRTHDALRVVVKGAPEAVLDACTAIRTGETTADFSSEDYAAWKSQNDEMGASGLRVLAFAEKTISGDTDPTTNDPYQSLVFLGLVALADPPRDDAREAIEACHSAGVRVVMVTGDQVPTAGNIAKAVGLSIETPPIHGSDLAENLDALSPEETEHVRRASVFARVSPEQKLALLRFYQSQGEIAAMLGDGVNDAPALRASDIGVAMGHRGVDVAREAADMVLRDDSFASIVVAIKQGRVIFDNIRIFVRYLISCNLSEIMVVLLGVAAQTPLPILPLQILFLNLITDVFPAIALGLGEGDPKIMERRPRDPQEPILTRRHWIECAAYGSVIAVSVFISLLVALHGLGFERSEAITVSFLTLAFAQLWHVFNMRAPRSSFLRNQVTRNPLVWLALTGCAAIVVAAVYIPWLAAPLGTVDPGRSGWTVVMVFSLLPTLLGQAWLAYRSSSTRG